MRRCTLICLYMTSCLFIFFAVCNAQQETPPLPGSLSLAPQTQNDLIADKGGIPEGFTSIFNGKDLDGWHVSKTNHHGTTPDYHVVHGLIVGTQCPIDSGGILLTNKRYKNVEVYMEIKPDWGNDSGWTEWSYFAFEEQAGNN